MADEQNSSEKQMLLHVVYIKDLSFESPNTPQSFAASLNGNNLLNIRSVNREIDADRVEVVLSLKVKGVASDDTIYLIELEQAGVFTIKGYTPEERHALLGSVCPNTLYPFAREAVDDVAKKGGFPAVMLQPIDFNALYTENMRQWAAQAEQNRTEQAPSAPLSEDEDPR